MRWFAPFWLGLVREFAAGFDHFFRPRHNIRNLKAEAGPCSLALATGVDADHRSQDFNLGNHFVLADHLAPKQVAIKPHRTVHVGSPQNVFHALNNH